MKNLINESLKIRDKNFKLYEDNKISLDELQSRYKRLIDRLIIHLEIKYNIYLYDKVELIENILTDDMNNHYEEIYNLINS